MLNKEFTLQNITENGYPKLIFKIYQGFKMDLRLIDMEDY